MGDGGLFSGFSLPLMVTDVNLIARKAAERRKEEQEAKAEADKREDERQRRLLHEEEQRLQLESEQRMHRLEIERLEREGAEKEAQRRCEQEKKEREERLRRQRQEEWENRLEHIKREIKKQQLKLMWDRWHAAYAERKEEQRRIEAVQMPNPCARRLSTDA